MPDARSPKHELKPVIVIAPGMIGELPFRAGAGALLLAFVSHVARAEGNPTPTSIEVFADGSAIHGLGSDLAVPAGTSELRFFVKPRCGLARYRLEGLELDWHERTDFMFLMVRFLNESGDQISQKSFPVSGRSGGWNGSVETSAFTPRSETFTVPEGGVYLSIAMTSAGPPSLVGVFAVSRIFIRSQGSPSRDIMTDSRAAGAPGPIWNKSGTHPTMASALHLDDGSGQSPVLIIRDDDLTSHADWATGVRGLPKVTSGETLEIQWKEAHSIGEGGEFSVIYDRLPPGAYRFVAEDLTIEGVPAGSVSSLSVHVPRPYWKHPGFWALCMAAVGFLAYGVGRQLIRRRIHRHLEQARMISDERLRIARDLHDDLGTRLSHISLLGSHAEGNSRDKDSRAAFAEIAGMSRELIGALSETVWMLNPKNNDLESLVDFLCRLVGELCRLSGIHCRIDAMTVTRNQPIDHDFRHNMTLAVKESVNNALKHASATEIRLGIHLDGNRLKISIADNGVGIARGSPRAGGVGLDSIVQRMTAIRGKCVLSELHEGGTTISLEAPLA